MPTRYVIVSTGESNSGGYALNSDASAGEVASRPEVQMWNVNTSVFENLDIGTNNNLDHAGLTSVTHGWELQLANDVASGVWSSLQNPMYYIQTGQGGSTISQWNVGGTYWTKFLARINAAKAAFTTAGITPSWIVFLSLGINDAIAGTSTSTLQTNMISWINRIKTELPSCKIVITELTPSWTTYTAVMRAIADSETDVAFAYTQDLGLRDTNHWSYAGMKSLSTRMSRLAQYMLGLADGKVFTNYTSTMYPALNTFGWTGSSPSVSGAIQKDPMTWGDGSFVSWLTPSGGSADGIVVTIESTKDTTHTWAPGQNFLYGAFRSTTTVWGGVNYTGVASRGASSDETRIYRSGNDALLQVRTTGGSWTTRHTATNAFAGVSQVYVHIINAISGSSDSLTLSFQLNPTITITAPATSSVSVSGTAQNITWTSTDVTGTVDILLSKDDGATWETLAAGETNDGTYSWTPTDLQVTATAKIKIQSSSNTSVSGTSGSFKIATTTAPGGGSGANTTEWAAVREMLSSAGVELIRV